MRKIICIVIYSLMPLTAGCHSIEGHYTIRNGKWFYDCSNWGAPNAGNYLQRVDFVTFKQFSDTKYGRDRYHVYFKGELMSGFDASSFEEIVPWYWRDKNQVYYNGKPIQGADPKSFKKLRYDNWAQDKRNVYIANEAINPKDVASFQLLNEEWAKDSQWYYPMQMSGSEYKPLKKIDYPTFRVLYGGWARDRYRAYWYSDVVKGVDLQSFTVMSIFDAYDKTWYYVNGKRIEPIERAKKDGSIRKWLFSHEFR